MVGFGVFFWSFLEATHRKILQKFFPKNNRNNDAKTPRGRAWSGSSADTNSARHIGSGPVSPHCPAVSPRAAASTSESQGTETSLQPNGHGKRHTPRNGTSQKVFLRSRPCAIRGGMANHRQQAFLVFFFQFLSKTLSGRREEKSYIYSPALKHVTKPG